MDRQALFLAKLCLSVYWNLSFRAVSLSFRAVCLSFRAASLSFRAVSLSFRAVCLSFRARPKAESRNLLSMPRHRCPDSLRSPDGKQSIIDTYIEGIIEYLEISKEKHPLINSVNYLCNQNAGHKKTRIHHQHLISGRGTTGTAPQIYGFYGI